MASCLADAGILFPAVTAGIPISADPARILIFPADLAELDTVGVVDVAVAGEAPLTVPDVFDRPELVAMIVAYEVETVEGIPVDYSGDYDDSDYKDPQNEFETMDGMPVYYGGDLNDSDCEDPLILLTKIGWIGVFLTLHMDIVGFSRMTGGGGQLPVTDRSSMMVEEEMAEPIRLRQDSWDASSLCGRY